MQWYVLHLSPFCRATQFVGLYAYEICAPGSGNRGGRPDRHGFPGKVLHCGGRHRNHRAAYRQHRHREPGLFLQGDGGQRGRHQEHHPAVPKPSRVQKAGLLLLHRGDSRSGHGAGYPRSPAFCPGRGGGLLQPQQGHGQSGGAGRGA